MKKPTPKKSAIKPKKIRATDTVADLTLEERKRLREILSDPVFEKAIALAARARPVAVPQLRTETGGLLSAEQTAIASTIRLAAISGWELFETSLYMQTDERVAPRRTNIEETFPDSGILGHDKL